jgi:hypothetical protein
MFNFIFRSASTIRHSCDTHMYDEIRMCMVLFIVVQPTERYIGYGKSGVRWHSRIGTTGLRLKADGSIIADLRSYDNIPKPYIS